MSDNKIQEKCAVCAAYLFPDDDVVCCPECGAPHHRECYSKLGHCGFEALHGTNLQYKKPVSTPVQSEPEIEIKVETDTVSCGMCGESYNKSEDNCPKCNAPNLSKSGIRFANFDYLGGVPADMELGGGVTADEAKKFVFTNTRRYIPKFAGFKIGKRASWNWFGFLFPSGWLLSRKMYVLGALIGALQIAASFLLFPFIEVIGSYELPQTSDYIDSSNYLMQAIIDDIDRIGIWVLIAAFVAFALNIAIRVLTAVFGDLWYKRYVINTVSDIKASSEDQDQDFKKLGGVNLFAGLIGIMAVNYLPQIVMMFI